MDVWGFVISIKIFWRFIDKERVFKCSNLICYSKSKHWHWRKMIAGVCRGIFIVTAAPEDVSGCCWIWEHMVYMMLSNLTNNIILAPRTLVFSVFFFFSLINPVCLFRRFSRYPSSYEIWYLFNLIFKEKTLNTTALQIIVTYSVRSPRTHACVFIYVSYVRCPGCLSQIFLFYYFNSSC